MRRFVILFLSLLSAAIAGCGGESGPKVTVGVAASASQAFSALAEAFEEQSETSVEIAVGSSEILKQQMLSGAPYDMVALADQKRLLDLSLAGAVDARTVTPYAAGVLTLWVPDASAEIDDAAAIAHDPWRNMRVSIANPKLAPYGAAAGEFLSKKGIAVEENDRVIIAGNVRQAMQYAETGNTDMALTAASLLTSSDGKKLAVDQQYYQPLIQGMALSATSGNQPGAREFYDFVLSEQGQSILREHGFQSAPEGGVADE